MFAFHLFSEWRHRVIYGETLTDALVRVKSLQRPDKYGKVTVAGRPDAIPGEIVDIARVICERSTAGSTRGSDKYESVLIESADGRINDVDAVRKPV